MSYLITGLGNPGNEYRSTRHNIGFMVVDHLSEKENFPWKEKFKGEYAAYSIAQEKGYLLKPQTFMNLSGESVQKAAHFFKFQPGEILIIHDELDLPFGVVELRQGGGLAGHNGLKSIAELLGTRDFLRLRLGIGRPKHGDVSNYVLSRFSDDEQMQLERYLSESVNVIEQVAVKGFDKVVRNFKKKNIIE